jgi:hypothetical protein
MDLKMLILWKLLFIKNVDMGVRNYSLGGKGEPFWGMLITSLLIPQISLLMPETSLLMLETSLLMPQLPLKLPPNPPKHPPQTLQK